LKRISTLSGRFALTSVAAAALWMSMPEAWAVGLGRVAVQSALGENLRAEIDVTSLTPEEASDLRVRVAPPEQFRAAGVDYNAVLPATQVTLARRADGRPYLKVSSVYSRTSLPVAQEISRMTSTKGSWTARSLLTFK
jgi:pilus assembly protein FimV